MTNKDIYLGALALIAEPVTEGAEDYAERAPYIMANFISENSALDGQYRLFLGAEKAGGGSPVYAAFDEEFPLSARFASAAQYYLASMLIADEDVDRADVFFDRFCTAMADILSEIPAMCEKIVSAYDV